MSGQSIVSFLLDRVELCSVFYKENRVLLCERVVHLARVVKKPEDRKDELLNIAIKLFMQKGYENTSVKDIYTEADGSFGMFYHHFKSKDEIFEASMDRLVCSFIEKISDVLLDEKKPFEKRYSMAMEHYIGLLQGRDKVSGFERGELDVSVFSKLSLKVLNKSVYPIQTFLEEGSRKGIVHVEDIHQAAVFVVYGIYGIIREEGLQESNLKNATSLLSKLSGLIAKILDSDRNTFKIKIPDKKMEDAGNT